MPRYTLLSLALLAGCTTDPAKIPVHGETPGHTCDAAGAGRFIGQPGTAGVMLTMDFRSDRVTVRLGPDRKITAVNCG